LLSVWTQSSQIAKAAGHPVVGVSGENVCEDDPLQ
jgi:hypothetical protein